MKKIYYSLIVLIIFTPLAFADTIYLKSGKEVKGKIIEESYKYVRVEVGGIILRYYLDEIDKVQKEVSPQAEVFTLKPSPLITPQGQQENIEAKPQVNSEVVTKPQTESAETQTSPQKPSSETPESPPKISTYNTTADAKDKLEIERIVKEYLNLVSKPLPKEKQEKKQRLQQLANILDLNNMPAFLLFKEILEQEAQKHYRVVEEGGSAEDKFLESDILGFQKKYITENKLNIEDFKITGIYFSKERDQATAVINIKDKVMTLKLQKKDSGWIINSTY